MKSLNFDAPLALAVAENATTPVPTGAGVSIWSTTASKLLTWNGTAWVGSSGSATSPGVFTPYDDNGQYGLVWTPGEYVGGAASGTGNLNFKGLTSTYMGLGAGSGYEGTHLSTKYTSGTTAYELSGVTSGSGISKRAGGWIFKCAVRFPAAPAGTSGFIGVAGNSGVYGDFPNQGYAGVGIGWLTTDTTTALRIMVGNGTTMSTNATYARTGSGGLAVGERFIRMTLTCAPGSTTAILDVYDETCQYYSIQKSVIDISTIPATTVLSPNCVACNVGSGLVTSAQLYELSCTPYPVASSFSVAATNILGNAATASALSSPITINGTPLNAGSSLTVSGGGGGSVIKKKSSLQFSAFPPFDIFPGSDYVSDSITLSIADVDATTTSTIFMQYDGTAPTSVSNVLRPDDFELNPFNFVAYCKTNGMITVIVTCKDRSNFANIHAVIPVTYILV